MWKHIFIGMCVIVVAFKWLGYQCFPCLKKMVGPKTGNVKTIWMLCYYENGYT